MLESFSPNEKLPGKCVKVNTRKSSAISSHHSQGRVSAKDGGVRVLLLKKLTLFMRDQPANHSGCHFLLALLDKGLSSVKW